MLFKIHPTSNYMQNRGQILPQAIKKPVTKNPLSRFRAVEKLPVPRPFPLTLPERKGGLTQVNQVFSLFQPEWHLVQNLANSKCSINVFGGI